LCSPEWHGTISDIKGRGGMRVLGVFATEEDARYAGLDWVRTRVD
jgi:hypothetical protein